MKTEEFDLGVTVRDKVSGLHGIVVSRIEYLSGCVQYGIQAGINKDGKVRDPQYIDRQQLVEVDKGVYEIRDRDGALAGTGGPGASISPGEKPPTS